MEALLNTDAVSSHHDVKGLKKFTTLWKRILGDCRLSDSQPEPTVACSRQYLWTICLLNSDWLSFERWLETVGICMVKVMEIVDWEVDAREHASVLTTSKSLHHRTPTAATLVTSNTGLTGNCITCIYCGQDHTSNSCTTITDVAAWREILRKAGSCYTCLKKYYLSKDCRSRLRCESCWGRHHVTIKFCIRSTWQATNFTASPHIRSIQNPPT